MNVQQYPFGFLSLLNAKSTGETPAQAERNLQLQLAMHGFYLAAIPLTTSSASNAGVSAVGAASSLTIPNGEAWKVLGVTADLTGVTAAVETSMAVSITPPDGTPGSLMAYQAPLVARAATQIFVAPWTAPTNDCVFGPGTIFNAVLCQALTAGTGNIRVRVVYRKLQV